MSSLPNSPLALPHLTKLCVSSNQISELPPEFLCALHSLEELDLSSNPLSVLPPSSAGIRERAGLSLISSSSASYTLVLNEQPPASALLSVGTHLSQLRVVLLAHCALGVTVAPAPTSHRMFFGPASLRRTETPKPQRSPLEVLGFLMDLKSYSLEHFSFKLYIYT